MIRDTTIQIWPLRRTVNGRVKKMHSHLIRVPIFIIVLSILSAIKPDVAHSVPGVLQSLELLNAKDRVRLQIYLDQSVFSPGKLDGNINDFTRKAAMRWIRNRHMKGKSGLNALIINARLSVPQPYRSYKITKDDRNRMGRVAFALRDKARQTSLPYSNLSEFVAEKFHCDELFLAHLNPSLDMKKIITGTLLVVPNVGAFDIAKDVPQQAGGTAATRIMIMWLENILEVHNSAGQIVASFPVTIGRESLHVKTGQWSIGNFTPHPEFRWDDSMLKTGMKGKRYHLLPPGPNNPVGVLWMGLNRPDDSGSHIGIHGTNHPGTVGRSHSAGCIRMTNWDVVKLAKLIEIGSLVEWKR